MSEEKLQNLKDLWGTNVSYDESDDNAGCSNHVNLGHDSEHLLLGTFIILDIYQRWDADIAWPVKVINCMSVASYGPLLRETLECAD